MKLLLIDGSNLIFRAFYATQNQGITNLKGEPVNAVYTLITMLDKLIKEQKPTHIYIAMDGAKETFRHKMYEGYKGGRVNTPQDLKVQFPIIKEYFTSLGIKFGQDDNYEADDLIATYAKIAKEKGIAVKIISGDKDLLQLIDKNVEVFTPRNGFAKEFNYDENSFEEKYGFKPHRFIEYKALVGDKSDNIIGIDKLGDKTAKKIIDTSTDIEDIINQAKDKKIGGKVGERLAQSSDILYKNIKLVTLIDNIDNLEALETLEFKGIDVNAYSAFLKAQGFMKVYKKVLEQNDLTDEVKEHSYEIIESFNINKHSDEITFVYSQSLGDNYILTQNLGVSISSQKGIFYLPYENINQEFLSFLESDKKKVFYNAKALLYPLKVTKIGGYLFDSYLALALIDSNNYRKDMANNLFGYGIFDIKHKEEVYASKANPKIPQDKNLMIYDLVCKVEGLRESYESILEQIKELELEKVLFEIEMPLSLMLTKMEQIGIYIDQENLNVLIKKYEEEVKEILDDIAKIVDININSSKQLATLLFEEWDLPKKGLKRTTTGYSTDIDNLEKLYSILDDSYEKQRNFIQRVLLYRKKSKVLSTYLLNIKRHILDDKKIHPLNHQLLAETGRLSVVDPNIQNIPIRAKESYEIREMFKGEKGNKIISFDYSQIELRIMASFCGDENMLKAFNNNEDIHTQTAKLVFGLDEVSPKQRSFAKAINFGIIYGMSPYGLAKQINVSNDEAKEFINKYFEQYPGINNFMLSKQEEVSKTKEVRTLFNRLRLVNNIDSKNYKEQEHAKRIAINTPIQGTAADIMKLALIEVSNKMEQMNFKSKLIMQIHDEIIFEVDKNEEEELITVVKKTMEEVVSLPVSLKVDYEIGMSWADAK